MLVIQDINDVKITKIVDSDGFCYKTYFIYKNEEYFIKIGSGTDYDEEYTLLCKRTPINNKGLYKIECIEELNDWKMPWLPNKCYSHMTKTDIKNFLEEATEFGLIKFINKNLK